MFARRGRDDDRSDTTSGTPARDDALFRLAFDGAPTGMMLVSAERTTFGRCLAANAALGRIVGRRAADLTGGVLSGLIDPSAPAILLNGNLPDGESRRLTTRLQHTDGHTVAVRLVYWRGSTSGSGASIDSGSSAPVFVVQLEELSGQSRGRAHRTEPGDGGEAYLPAAEQAVLSDVGDWMAARLADRASTAWAAAPSGRPLELPPIEAHGIGTPAAWAVLRDEVLPTAFPTDHPRYLAFVGGAATPAAVLADAALSAAAVYGSSTLEAGAVVDAESAAIRWLCDLVGYDGDADGTFVSGGSLANLSALVAARHGRLNATGAAPSVIVAGAGAHVSVSAAAAIMGCTVVSAGEVDEALTGAHVRAALDGLDVDDVVAVVATAGATNTGVVDALDEVAAVCAERGLWLHVDAAYGGAALLSSHFRSSFAGIDRADSVTIDPHKWLFTPLDCGAVLYRDAARARAAHQPKAAYLDAVNSHAPRNPADYAVHLTRRARGVPLWMSLVANGADAYAHAVDRCIAVAHYAADQIAISDVLELVQPPQLSVVLLRRIGWSSADYARWSRRMRESALALVTPTVVRGETVLRLCLVNPLTSEDDIDLVLDELLASCVESQRSAS